MGRERQKKRDNELHGVIIVAIFLFCFVFFFYDRKVKKKKPWLAI